MIVYNIEPEIQDGGRALPDTQVLFAGAPRDFKVANPVPCSWYGTEVDSRRGAFGYVKESAGLEAMVGEFLRFTYQRKSVTVFCLGQTPDIATPVALARRPFAELALLPVESIYVYTEIID